MSKVKITNKLLLLILGTAILITVAIKFNLF